MRREDGVRLRHMLDAAEEAMRFASGATRKDLDTNRLLTFGLVRAVEIIGEASTKVGAETKAAHPSLPWGEMAAMRNRLIHAYFDVDLDRLWDTVTVDLPELIPQLHLALSGSP